VRHEALLFADGGERPSIALPSQRQAAQENGPVATPVPRSWVDLTTHVSAAMRRFTEAHPDWLTEVRVTCCPTMPASSTALSCQSTAAGPRRDWTPRRREHTRPQRVAAEHVSSSTLQELTRQTQTFQAL
jgi:hypothetical protein